MTVRSRDFLLSSASLVASQVFGAGLGFVFWLVASKTFSQSDVGFAAAVTSGISLAAAFGAMGLGTLLVYEFPRRPGFELGMLSASLLASAAFGGLIGFGFVVVAPMLSPDFAVLHQSLLMNVLVVAGASATAASLVLDQALVGLMRSDLQLARNLVMALVRVGMLAVFTAFTLVSAEVALVSPWAVSAVVSMLVLAAFVGWRGGLRRAYPFHWQFLSEQWIPALQHHVLNLALQIPGWVLPIVAVVVVSAASNGGFFLAWQLLGIAAFVQVALLSMLYAAAARNPESLERWGWITFWLSIIAALASAIGLWILGPLVLELFGRGYRDAGGEALFALPLTLFGVAIKGHYVAIHRVRGTVTSATRVVALAAIMEMAGGFLGGRIGGLRGLGIGVVVAIGIESIPMLPILYREIISPGFRRWRTPPEPSPDRP